MAGTSTVYGGTGPAGDIYFNYTPLVDVTFNLILYFVLTSTINTAAMGRVVLPKPDSSTAVDRKELAANRVIVNVISSGVNDKDGSLLSGTAKRYEIDSEPITVGNREQLIQKFKVKREATEKVLGKAKMEDFFVEVRADRRVNYADIEPILTAAAEANIPKMNITALVDIGR